MNGRLLAVDLTGALVIIELKRDDSGADVHWQAIKYASYLRSADGNADRRMLAKYEGVSDLTKLRSGCGVILAQMSFPASTMTSA